MDVKSSVVVGLSAEANRRIVNSFSRRASGIVSSASTFADERAALVRFVVMDSRAPAGRARGEEVEGWEEMLEEIRRAWSAGGSRLLGKRVEGGDGGEVLDAMELRVGGGGSPASSRAPRAKAVRIACRCIRV